MILEVDIRDWDRVDFKAVERSTESLGYTALLHQYQYLDTMWGFIRQVEQVYQKQTEQASKLIPALLRKKEV